MTVVGADARDRLRYLQDTVDLLWPGLGAGSGPRRVVLPNARRPRMLVPAAPRRAAVIALRDHTRRQPWKSQAASALLATAVAAGGVRWAPSVAARTSASGGEDVDDLLGEVLGHPVVTTLALTPPRPNRKPVLQVFDRRGRTVAFAKVGIGPLAGALVRHEAAALQALERAGLHRVVTPRRIALTEFRGFPMLVMTPLPHPVRRLPAGDVLVAAMVEVSRAGRKASFGEFVRRLRERAVAGLDPHADVPGGWLALLEDAASRGPELPCGAWHGDWTVWNCAPARTAVAVWDWERFDDRVPAGFDRLHYALNDALGPRRTGFGAAARCLADGAAGLLQPWALSGPAARWTAAWYLLEISSRYLLGFGSSTQSGRPPEDARVEQWALPEIRRLLRT